MPLRVAVIGAGHIGSRHLDAYLAEPSCKVVSVCDILVDRADVSSKRANAIPTYSVDQLLGTCDLDAVSVCTSGAQNGSHHFMPVMRCLDAGIHVLCEKPLSNQLVEARSMVDRAKQKGVHLGTDLNHRFTPQAEAAQKWMREGRIGHPLLINMTLWIDNPNDRSPWMHLRALHPHSLDVMRTFCGPVRSVQAFFVHAPLPDGTLRNSWSSAQINLLFRNGVVGHLTGSYDADMRHHFERCEVMGTEGRFVIENSFERATLYPRQSNECTVIANPLFTGLRDLDDTITRRVHHWVQQLNAEVPVGRMDADGSDGLAVQEIIESAITSWEEDRVVEVENG